MDNSGARRIIPIILILIVIAVAIAAVVSIGQNIFGGNTTEEVNQGQRSLLDTSESRTVRMTVRGPIIANEQFTTYSITVKPGSRNMTTYLGYLSKQVETVERDNNIPAYEQLVYALDRSKMMDASEPEGEKNDTRGICATGRMFTFETLNNSTVIKSLWTTTCNDSRGTLSTNFVPLQNLFLRQIPTSSELINRVTAAAQKAK